MTGERETSEEGNKNGGRKMSEQKVSFYKLFTFADRLDLFLMIIGTICAIANGVAKPVMILMLGDIIDVFGSTDNSEMVHAVSKIAVQFVYLGIGAGVAACIQLSSWMVTGERQSARIRSLYLKTILRQDITFFDMETTSGEVVGRMSGDTILIQAAMGEKVGKFIQLVSTFIGGFAIAFVKGWHLALVMMSCIPVIVVTSALVSLYTSKSASRGQIAYAEAGNCVEQTVGAIRTVASFTGEKQALEKYNRSLLVAYKFSVQQGLISGIGLGVILVVIFASYGLAVWYGSRLIITKGYNGGQVITVMVAIMNGGTALGQSSPSLNAFAAGQAAAYKMFEALNRKPLIDAYDTKGIVLEDIKGDIELKDVHFSYPARPDHKIFSGFNLTVPSGKTAALVGQSGSGKSTVISLVERFYDPSEGEVLIDGVNLKQLRLKWIREKIGLVSQEPILFTTTIKENIAYGKEKATDAEIRTAIQLANAATFIDRLPNGLDTMVGEHGTQLSGGQKQRIAIARAILKNPKILLLDEATSALDAESERIVQDALTRIMLNRTTVVVAHRLTTIRNADQIAVVHMGKIIEQGAHEELIQDPEGAYSQLVRFQEGRKESELKSEPIHDPISESGRSMTKSASPRLSVRKSTSQRSSSISRSLSTTLGVMGPIGDHETEVLDEENFGKSDDQPNQVHSKGSVRRLAYMNKPELPALLLGSLAAAIQGVMTPVFGVLLSSSIKIFYESHHQLQKDSRFWALTYVLLGLAAIITGPMQHYYFGIAGSKLILRLRSMCFEKVVHQEISWFDDPSNSSGAIGARLSGDASTVKTLVGDALALLAENAATIIAAIIIAFSSNWLLSLVVLVLLPFVCMQAYAQAKFLEGFSADAKVLYEEASQVANDAVGGIRTVASFCAEEKVMDLYQMKCDAPMKKGLRAGVVSDLGFGVSTFVLYGAYATCFYAGAHFMENGRANFQQVFRVFFCLTISAVGISNSTTMAPDFSKARDAAASILNIIDSKPKIDSSKEDGTTLNDMRGDIELEHVAFKYPTRPNVPIFRDLSLLIPSGKTVALVGESGSGKSTVISLLERFYDPDSGHVFLDGVDIQRFNINWLRQQMGLVSQEPILFSGTIRTNLAYGKQGEVTEEEIVAATTAANCHDFISGLPQGYDTWVGERGVQLSGGQKQRIAIARAILKDPKILLLDEATSALDAESERVVQDALDRVMVNRTTVVVAHRLSTIKGADVIAVFKKGGVAEKGRHEDLLEIEDGVYASLVSLHMTSS